ncbi:AzlD domain-containing protein [bacterium]|nr:AzlD domain-containing protein [bacterium]
MIETSSFWIVVVGLMLGTFSIRYSLIAISSRVKISERIKELFSFIPAAILPAFITPSAFFHNGQAVWLLGRERLFILILATFVCLWARSTLLTICFGLVGLYLIAQF